MRTFKFKSSAFQWYNFFMIIYFTEFIWSFFYYFFVRPTQKTFFGLSKELQNFK